ncbi:MAG: TldD/PmbA family protein [Bacilli bacterium]|jgi:PmbA protein|nr:TldD/PmbA family protein [Bacilli bacterium]
MNFKKFFVAAEKEQIAPFEISYSKSAELSIKVYMDEVEEYTSAEDISLGGRGIYQGKSGAFSTDRVDSKVIGPMMEAIKSSAAYGRTGDPTNFISTGMKYHHVKAYSKALDETPAADLVKLGLEISKGVRAAEKRISMSEVNISRSSSIRVKENSNGLKLKDKGNYLSLSCTVKIEEGKGVQSYFDYVLINDLGEFDKETFIKHIAEEAAKKLGAETIKSGKYNVVLSPDCTAIYLAVLLEQLSSFSVSQHLSLFEGKLDQQVLSKKLTVKEDPWAGNPFSSSFDDEGIPTQRKTLVDKGVIKTFLYDLEMAKKEGKQSTGNGYLSNGNIKPSLGFVKVKNGHKSLDQLLETVGQGLYIDELEGIGTGLNPQSGDYSLQASGFLIENGKLGKPVCLITVAGNLLLDLGKIIAVADNSRLTYYSVEAPSIAIRKMAISGK